jgi:hypothetical protein
MSRKRVAGVAGAVGLALLHFAPAALAWGEEGACKWRCPPPFVHCQERPPCVKMKCVCPRPVCNPCALEHAGYYQTCWQPWPYPPDWSHCPVPPPGAVIAPPLGPVHPFPGGVPGPLPGDLPGPRKVTEAPTVRPLVGFAR